MKTSHERQARNFILWPALLICSTALFGQTPSPVIFDAPDAGTGTYQGTTPIAISSTGLIAGNYIDSHTVSHSFRRGSDGTITEFDVPGFNSAAVTGINASGQIIGYGKIGRASC